MSKEISSALAPSPPEVPKKKLGPCCVCKETKKFRDACLMAKQENECSKEIFNHNECLRENGFEPIK
jgi:cytochrome c oxidase assembly protein subunit 17